MKTEGAGRVCLNCDAVLLVLVLVLVLVLTWVMVDCGWSSDSFLGGGEHR